MTIDQAQQDMRHAYFNGVAGLFASATVWLAAALVAYFRSPTDAVWALLLGGMAIHPLAVVLCKALGRPGKHDPANPLGRLALEGTVWFLLAIPVAYVVSMAHTGWFFPAMLLLIGGRYLTFQTLYGLRIYWVCGAVLALTGVGAAVLQASAFEAAFVGAAIEYGFAAAVAAGVKRAQTARAA